MRYFACAFAVRSCTGSPEKSTSTAQHSRYRESSVAPQVLGTDHSPVHEVALSRPGFAKSNLEAVSDGFLHKGPLPSYPEIIHPVKPRIRPSQPYQITIRTLRSHKPLFQRFTDNSITIIFHP